MITVEFNSCLEARENLSNNHLIDLDQAIQIVHPGLSKEFLRELEKIIEQLIIASFGGRERFDEEIASDNQDNMPIIRGSFIFNLVTKLYYPEKPGFKQVLGNILNQIQHCLKKTKFNELLRERNVLVPEIDLRFANLSLEVLIESLGLGDLNYLINESGVLLHITGLNSSKPQNFFHQADFELTLKDEKIVLDVGQIDSQNVQNTRLGPFANSGDRVNIGKLKYDKVRKKWMLAVTSDALEFKEYAKQSLANELLTPNAENQLDFPDALVIELRALLSNLIYNSVVDISLPFDKSVLGFRSFIDLIFQNKSEKKDNKGQILNKRRDEIQEYLIVLMVANPIIALESLSALGITEFLPLVQNIKNELMIAFNAKFRLFWRKDKQNYPEEFEQIDLILEENDQLNLLDKLIVLVENELDKCFNSGLIVSEKRELAVSYRKLMKFVNSIYLKEIMTGFDVQLFEPQLLDQTYAKDLLNFPTISNDQLYKLIYEQLMFKGKINFENCGLMAIAKRHFEIKGKLEYFNGLSLEEKIQETFGLFILELDLEKVQPVLSRHTNLMYFD